MTVTATSAPSSLLCRSRSSGKATAPAAIAAMTAAMTRNVFIVYLLPRSLSDQWAPSRGVRRMRRTSGHGRDACVPRVAMGATHALRGWPWMDTQGLRGAGTAQRNGHPGLARSRDCAAQWPLRACAQQGLRSAMPQQAHHWSDRLLGFRGGFIVERHACTLA